MPDALALRALPEPVRRMEVYERESQRYGLEPMSVVDAFTADQMASFAREAVMADRRRRDPHP